MRWLLVVGMVVLAGCTMCTLKLVRGSLRFELPDTEANALTAAPSTIEACIDDTCWSDALDETGTGSVTSFNGPARLLEITREQRDGGVSLGVTAGATSDVSLTLSRDGGIVFTHAWSNVTFEKTEPNGPGCGELYQLEAPLTF